MKHHHTLIKVFQIFNVGLIANYKNDYFDLFKKIKLIEKKTGKN